ncbi:MAG: hypothetical protein RL135_450, partial [Bacteroidota bacterium]
RDRKISEHAFDVSEQEYQGQQRINKSKMK